MCAGVVAEILAGQQLLHHPPARPSRAPSIRTLRPQAVAMVDGGESDTLVAEVRQVMQHEPTAEEGVAKDEVVQRTFDALAIRDGELACSPAIC